MSNRKDVFFLVLTKYIDHKPRTVVNGHDVELFFGDTSIAFFNTHCVFKEKSYGYDDTDELLQKIDIFLNEG